MKQTELSCLIDLGHIKSIGWFVTHHLDTIELGLCPFDGSVSGFRWNEEAGWEPIFVACYSSRDDPGVISIFNSTENNPYSEADIALGLDEFFARQRQQGEAQKPD